MRREGKAGGYKWNIWVSVWVGPVISAFAILLYILVLDIDIPSIKPRQSLENASATIVYFAHVGNIIAAFVLAGALLQDEYALLLVWLCWSVIFTLFVIILIPMSVFTLLRHIPARIILHSASLLASLWSLVNIIRIYRNRDSYDWEGRVGGAGATVSANFRGENNKVVSRESNVL